MEYFRITNIMDGVQPLSNRLIKELQDGRQVLWLVSGGSNIKLSAAVMKLIPEELTKRLSITLTDERFGPVGHKDSNQFQLEQAGFQTGQAAVYKVLQGLDLDQTVDAYAEAFARMSDQADVVIAQFGMGSDGHIAGILPGSPAVMSPDLVCGYQSDPYTRITLTPEALETIDCAYLFVAGTDKHAAIEKLGEDLSLEDQPAQILKAIPEAYVYNDLKGE